MDRQVSSLRSLTIIFLQLITLFYLSSAATISASDHLLRGSSLHVKDAASNVLVSPNKIFTCGFYTLSGANAYWFAIWFTNTKEKTVVWMANRDNPVNGHGSSLTLGKHGALVLTDLDGSKAWEPTTSVTNVHRVRLLDSGNLVLQDPTGIILWQSFDFPTDTLLPNQKFTKNSKLISRFSPEMYGSGYYSLFFDNDNVMRMAYNGPEISSIYWPNPDPNLTVYDNGRTNYNSSRIASFDDTGTFVSSDLLQFYASDMGLGIIRRLSVDHDGNLRLYSLNNSSGLWSVTWQAFAKQCDVHGLCGRNEICIYTPNKPVCSCPPYYEPTSLTDWSPGCTPKFNRSCSDMQFIELPKVDYYGFDLKATQNISFFDCQQLCSGDCRCQGFKYIAKGKKKGKRKCFTKSALFNGYNSKASFYIRIPTRGDTNTTTAGLENLTISRLDCGDGQPKVVVELSNNADYNYGYKQKNFNWIYMFAFTGGIGAFEVLILIVSWAFFLRKYSVLSATLEDGYRAISSQFRSFSYDELKSATGKFAQILGRGGFGTVYKGVLADDRVIAVKKLEDVVQGEEEFWAEVSTFSRINHMNLARMWGFCSSGKNRLLVYEFIENRSLDKHLFSSDSSGSLLGWKQRLKIASGTAKGLAYLHHECLEWVVHCDIKPENILLDRNFEPKISDFGLAKLCQRSGGHGTSELSKIRGTKGYMAPEWTTNLPLTAKVDVYSFGVVILELVRGVRLSSCLTDEHLPAAGQEEIPLLSSFVRYAKMKMQDGEDESWIEDLVDPRLQGNFSRNQVCAMIQIGLSCVEDDRNKRPTMESVVQVLADCQTETVMPTPDNL